MAIWTRFQENFDLTKYNLDRRNSTSKKIISLLVSHKNEAREVVSGERYTQKDFVDAHPDGLNIQAGGAQFKGWTVPTRFSLGQLTDKHSSTIYYRRTNTNAQTTRYLVVYPAGSEMSFRLINGVSDLSLRFPYAGGTTVTAAQMAPYDLLDFKGHWITANWFGDAGTAEAKEVWIDGELVHTDTGPWWGSVVTETQAYVGRNDTVDNKAGGVVNWAMITNGYLTSQEIRTLHSSPESLFRPQLRLVPTYPYDPTKVVAEAAPTGVIITDVNTTESWTDGDTGLIITGTGFV